MTARGHQPVGLDGCFGAGIYEKKAPHTLTLGQALMPAGLSVEGRIVRHACGSRRAWLKNH